MGQKIFHKNQKDELKSLISKIEPKRIFIVRDNNSYQISGAESFINQLVGEKELVSFYDFNPNPQLQDLKKGIELFQRGKFDLIIAIGGGSVLDMGKLIRIFSNQKSKIEDIVLGKSQIDEAKTPLLAIPTTAGTGAEATQFAVLYIDKKKYSVSHPTVLPDYVYLSSVFSLSASPYLNACTGLDAFCQAVESIWSIKSNAESEKYALKAVKLVWDNLQDAIQEQNEHTKDKMQEASFLAGKAINITTTTAPHALSYAFTSYYKIPHGHAVALSFPFFINFNYFLTIENCIDPKGPESVKERIDKILNIIKTDIRNAPSTLLNFFNDIKINISISELIKDFDPNVIINNVNIERLTNNPRAVSKNDIWDFLNKSF